MTRRGQLRRTLVWLGVILGAAAAGYVATCAIFPAPILTHKFTVPALRGAATNAAVTRLAALRLRARITDTVADPLTPAGTIAWQSPAPQTQLPEGAVVRLAVSSGAPSVLMPDVTDLDVTLARQVIDAAGLRISRIDTVTSPAQFASVISTVPSAGTSLQPGDSVVMAMSTGPASVPVPALVGLTVAVARDRLVAAGLRMGALTQRFEGKAGTIIAQQPQPGILAAHASAVDLTISGTMP